VCQQGTVVTIGWFAEQRVVTVLAVDGVAVAGIAVEEVVAVARRQGGRHPERNNRPDNNGTA
jgi:hypothetical protein